MNDAVAMLFTEKSGWTLRVERIWERHDYRYSVELLSPAEGKSVALHFTREQAAQLLFALETLKVD